MRFITIIIFAVTNLNSLVSLAIAKPVLKREPGGIAIPLARNPSYPKNESTDLDAITSHGISVREKILGGLDNYEVNTGMMHPFAVKRSKSELGTRGASVPLITHQYGGWIGQISIGTPPQTLQVAIDTGTADTWVVESGFPGHSALSLDLWNPVLSKSATKLNKPFQFTNSDGSFSVKGSQFIDRITIGGYTSTRQTFGSATWHFTSLPQMDQYPAGGVLGLALPSISTFDAFPLLETIPKYHGFKRVFSLKLSSVEAELWIGGSNRLLYNGRITYTRVTNPGFWHVSMDDIRGSVTDYKIVENVPVIFDTGASYIYGDWERVSNLYGHFGGTLIEHGGFGYYYMPCDSFPTLGFTFGGKTFEIPPDTLRLNQIKEGSDYCFSGIIARRSPIEFWSVGITFLQGVYSVFDYENLRVGFAELA